MGLGPDVSSLLPAWKEKVESILTLSTLPAIDLGFAKKGGKDGVHSEHHGYILAEMQSLARAYPDATW
jgi:ring-1,2-phenylacetyl-CoA epoxidase subunit PaaC